MKDHTTGEYSDRILPDAADVFTEPLFWILGFDDLVAERAYHVINRRLRRVLVIGSVCPSAIVDNSAARIPLIGTFLITKAKKLAISLCIEASAKIDVGRFGQDMVIAFAKRTSFAENIVFFQRGLFTLLSLASTVLVSNNYDWLTLVGPFCTGNQPVLGRRLWKGIHGIARFELGAKSSKGDVHFVGVVACHLETGLCVLVLALNANDDENVRFINYER